MNINLTIFSIIADILILFGVNLHLKAKEESIKQVKKGMCFFHLY